MNRHDCPSFTVRKSGRARLHDNRGISLLEILICAGILVIILTGMFRLFIYSAELNDMSRNVTVVMSEVQGRMEAIRNHNFNLITTDYIFGGTPGDTFNLSQVTGIGVITMDASNTKLLKIRIVACWRNQNGRVIGEDKNLNGTLDAGEDLDGNGLIDSPAVIESYVARL
ncbi:MAG TPA: hypothetical protein PLB05_03890 [Candidatus Omnitrophota bacterium]|nr:hypothetical protein [Candidatus Omnitrophota bacterium]